MPRDYMSIQSITEGDTSFDIERCSYFFRPEVRQSQALFHDKELIGGIWYRCERHACSIMCYALTDMYGLTKCIFYMKKSSCFRNDFCLMFYDTWEHDLFFKVKRVYWHREENQTILCVSVRKRGEKGRKKCQQIQKMVIHSPQKYRVYQQ
jgi:hypothetical protein